MDLADLLSDSVMEWCEDNSNEADEADYQSDIDRILLAAIESFEQQQQQQQPRPLTSKYETPRPLTSPTPTPLTTSSNRPFATPKTQQEIADARVSAVPKKTQQDTEYCVRLWEEWCQHRRNNFGDSIPQLTELQPTELQQWLTYFILELRRKDGSEFTPDTLHHICCGIMRHLRWKGQPAIDFFKDPEFADFRRSLDAEMKRLQAAGKGTKKKQAEPLTIQEEEILWQKGLLGDHNPQVLLDTIIFMNGLNFALRSGKEHRQLRFIPPQIELVEKQGERAYLVYREDISKNRPGGLKGRKMKPKVVYHHENLDNPHRCFVRLYKLYMSLCPADRPADSFYLMPLQNPSATCWYSTRPLGYHKLGTTVARLCKSAEIPGYKTNHSLRVTAATRLYDSGIDEQLVMETTGHCSTEGVRTYKRTSETQRQAVSDILSAKRICVQHPIPPEKPQSSEIVPIQGQSSTFELSNTTSTSIPAFISFPFMLICHHQY